VLDCAGRRFHATLTISEQVDVFGRAVDDPMRDQSAAARQREPVRRGRAQCDNGDLAVQIVQRR
jgi:hypothetical protein